MAICMVFTPPKELYTKEHYEKVLEHMGSGFPPAAMKMHVMGEAMGISLDEVLKHASVFEIEKTINK